MCKVAVDDMGVFVSIERLDGWCITSLPSLDPLPLQCICFLVASFWILVVVVVIAAIAGIIIFIALPLHFSFLQFK